MKDCSLTLTVRDGKVKMDGRGVSVVELAELSGILQILAGEAAMARGVGLDEVKDNMLDIHLAAMAQAEEHARRKGRETKGGADGKL